MILLILKCHHILIKQILIYFHIIIMIKQFKYLINNSDKINWSNIVLNTSDRAVKFMLYDSKYNSKNNRNKIFDLL